VAARPERRLHAAGRSLVRVLRNPDIRALELSWTIGVGVDWAILIVALVQLPQAASTTRDRRHQTDALFIWVYVSLLTELSVLGAQRQNATLHQKALQTPRRRRGFG